MYAVTFLEYLHPFFFNYPENPNFSLQTLLESFFATTIVLTRYARDETDHSTASSAEVRIGGAVPPFPHTCSRHGTS
jgi:hypothetical protein